MIQITPQMKILVAVEPADFRKGIDGLAQVCKEVLKHDPFGGQVFVFRNRPATATESSCVRRPRFLALSQAFVQWPLPLVADSWNGGGQKIGGPPTACSSLGRQSRSGASSPAVAIGWPGRLTRCLGIRETQIASNRSYRFHEPWLSWALA